ncbi:MAG: arylsulfatase [Candidatus Nealsonbacteria bacterium]|nr:arylsulfatase [Candidatus Nealsonbacteria bacterium]
MKSALLLLAAVLICGNVSFAAEPPAAKPNVVFIMADDLGIGDVGCYGKELCKIDTPHIDALATQGMRFTDAHSVASVCVPVRVAIMTGRYPWRIQGAGRGGPWGFLSPRMPTGHFTLGRMMRKIGYRTGYVGKWHLGTRMPTTDGKPQGLENVDYTRPLEIGPPQYGFDHSFILPGSLDMYPYVFVRNGQFVGQVTAQRGWSAFNRVGPTAADFEDYKVLDTLSREAEQFVARSAEAARDGKPFFLYFALTAPHTPTCPSPAFEGKSKLGLYGDFVAETDDCVGRITKSLKQHGLDQNTLVIVTSDHGPAPYAGNVRKATVDNLRDLEKLGHHSSGIYRGYKFSVYEGGLRVPLVVRYPGVVRPGTQCDRLVGLNDLMRTLADLCGYEPADDEAPDSISFLPLLRDPAAESPRTSLVMQGTHAFVIRRGKWKLAICPGSGCQGAWGNTPSQNDAWQQAVEQFGRKPSPADLRAAPFVQLFDLEHDVREQKNVAAEHPEIVQQLFDLLDGRIAAGRSTPGEELTNDVPNPNYHSRIPPFVRQR